MKKKKIVEKKLEEVKETIQEQIKNGDNTFSYWLGFRRALEWMLENQDKHKL
jgi:hypothetical protein